MAGHTQGINIHKPGENNLTGLTVKKRPISAGCLLIDINSWNRFIGHFEAEDQKEQYGKRHGFEISIGTR